MVVASVHGIRYCEGKHCRGIRWIGFKKIETMCDFESEGLRDSWN